MNGSTVIEVVCRTLEAQQFLDIGFSLTGQTTDSRVHLIHRAARREHVLALLTLSRYGLAFHGQDEGNASIPPSVFSAADGTIICATWVDSVADSGQVARYKAHLARTQELMANRGRQADELLVSR